MIASGDNTPDKSGKGVPLKVLYIVRHGETQWNVQRRMQGRMDSPLTEQGQDQARINGQLIDGLGGVERLWVSPSGRTTETAHIINAITKAQIDFIDVLMERDCGAWSGLTLAEIEQRYPEQWAARDVNPYLHRPPDGENLADMHSRVGEFLETLFAFDWQAICLVTHGVMSKVILKYYLALAEIECTRIRHPNNLVYRLNFFADRIEVAHHLQAGEAQQGLLYAHSELQQHPTNQ